MAYEEDNESTFTVKFKIDDDDIRQDLQSVRQAIQDTISGGYTNLGGGGRGGEGGGAPAVGLGYGGGGAGGGGAQINLQGGVFNIGGEMAEFQGPRSFTARNVFIEPTQLMWRKLPPDFDQMTVGQFLDWIQDVRTTPQGTWGRMFGERGALEVGELLEGMITIFQGQIDQENISRDQKLIDLQGTGGFQAMATGARALTYAVINATRSGGMQFTTVISDLRKAFMETSRLATGAYGISGQQMTLAHSGFQQAIAQLSELVSADKTAIQEFGVRGGRMDVYVETLLRSPTGLMTAMTGIEVKMEAPTEGAVTNLGRGTARQVTDYAQTLLRRYISANQGTMPTSSMFFKYPVFGFGEWSSSAETFFQDNWAGFVKAIGSEMGIEESAIPTFMLQWKNIFPTVDVTKIITPDLADHLSRVSIIDPGRAKQLYTQIVMKGLLSNETTEILVKLLPAAVLLDKEAQLFSMSGIEGGGFSAEFRRTLNELSQSQGNVSTILNPFISFGQIGGESGQFMDIGDMNNENAMTMAVLNRVRHYSAQARAQSNPKDIAKYFAEGRFEEAASLGREMNLPPDMFLFFSRLPREKLQLVGQIVQTELTQMMGVPGADIGDLQNSLIASMSTLFGVGTEESGRLFGEYDASRRLNAFRSGTQFVNESFDDLWNYYTGENEVNFCFFDRITFSGPNCPQCGQPVDNEYIVKIPPERRRGRESMPTFNYGGAGQPSRRGEPRGFETPYWVGRSREEIRQAPSMMVGGLPYQNEKSTFWNTFSFLYPFFRTGSLGDNNDIQMLMMEYAINPEAGRMDIMGYSTALGMLEDIAGDRASDIYGTLPMSLAGPNATHFGAMGMWMYNDLNAIQASWRANMNPRMAQKMKEVQTQIRKGTEMYESSVVNTLIEEARTSADFDGDDADRQAKILSSMGSIGGLMTAAMAFQREIDDKPETWEIGRSSPWRALGKTKGEVVAYLGKLYEIASERLHKEGEGRIDDPFNVFGMVEWLNNRNLNLSMATDITVWNLALN